MSWLETEILGELPVWVPLFLLAVYGVVAYAAIWLGTLNIRRYRAARGDKVPWWGLP